MLKELMLILALGTGLVLARSVSPADEDYNAYIDIPFKRIKTSVSAEIEMQPDEFPCNAPFHICRLNASNRMVILLKRIRWRLRTAMC